MNKILHFHSVFSGIKLKDLKKFFAVLLSPEVVLNYID